jgi:hypothetical protein
MILQDINGMLLDRFLADDLSNYYGSQISISDVEWRKPLMRLLSEADIPLVNWLILNLDERGVFDKKKRDITDIDRRELRKLNRILLAGIFQTETLQFLKGSKEIIYVEKSSIISTMESAGYQFICEYNFLPHHYFLEFKRKF